MNWNWYPYRLMLRRGILWLKRVRWTMGDVVLLIYLVQSPFPLLFHLPFIEEREAKRRCSIGKGLWE
jgi:hypothetical protein